MNKTSAGVVTCVLVFAIAASSGSAGSDIPSASKLQSCGTVDFGYTDASVSAKKVNCPSARKIVRKWSRKTEPGVPAPPFLQVKNFLCEFKGSDSHLKLRCKNTVGDSRKRVHADWGGQRRYIGCVIPPSSGPPAEGSLPWSLSHKPISRL